MLIACLAACLLILTMGSCAVSAPLDTMVSPVGAVEITQSGKPVAAISTGLFESVWQGAGLSGAPSSEAAAGVQAGTIRAPGGVVVDSQLRCEADGDAVTFRYTLTPRGDIKLNSLHVSLELPELVAAGGTWKADADSGEFPLQRGDTHLRSQPTSDLQLILANGKQMRLQFESATSVLLQDNRQWGPSFSVRMGPQMANEDTWPGGKALEVAFTLSSPDGVKLEFDTPVSIQASDDWVPLTLDLDIEEGSALDFSGFGQLDAPAGKHGNIIATPDGHLAFADIPDEPQRFYGVNFCFTAQYITHEQADRLADRLMRLGYNTVRFHHFESPVVDRSGGTSTKFLAKELDQLDYLFAALKKRGIYVTIDLFISRSVYASEIWPGADGNVAMDQFKMLVPVNETAFENWKAYSRALLDHVNPYTEMRWADDPTLGWISMINEGNVGNFINGVQGRLRDDWQAAWNRWLAAKYASKQELSDAWGADPGGDSAQGTIELGGTGSAERSLDFLVFLADTERTMFERMRSFLRDEVGTKALLTNMNGWSNPVQNQLARAEYDYVDDHFYVDHPQFLEESWRLPSRCQNTSPVAAGAPGGRYTAFTRMLGKPFTISEYNYSGPGRFRGVGGIITGCMAALQDWSVVWRFAYSHTRDNLFNPGTAGYFDVASDPLNQAAERASLCLFLRGDMKPAEHTVAITLSEDDLRARSDMRQSVSPPWSALALVTRVGTSLEGDGVDADLVLKAGDEAADIEPYSASAGGQIVEQMRERGWLNEGNLTDLRIMRHHSETGQLLVDAPEDMLVLNTPGTMGGYAPAGRTIDTDAVSISIDETDATVWVSSLDENPIAASRRLLITHLTDLQNTDAKFGERARQTLLSWGKLPHLVRNGRATVTVTNANAADAEVWALATGGRRLARVDARCENGKLIIPLCVAGDEGARMLYEVVFPN